MRSLITLIAALAAAPIVQSDSTYIDNDTGYYSLSISGTGCVRPTVTVTVTAGENGASTALPTSSPSVPAQGSTGITTTITSKTCPNGKSIVNPSPAAESVQSSTSEEPYNLSPPTPFTSTVTPTTTSEVDPAPKSTSTTTYTVFAHSADHTTTDISISPTLQSSLASTWKVPSNVPAASQTANFSSNMTSASPSSTAPALPQYPGSCPTTPQNYIAMQNYYGLNMVNTKPCDPSLNKPCGYRTPDDWDTALHSITEQLPQINAIRLYTVLDAGSEAGHDVNYTHLANALGAAKANEVKILAGVWSGGVGHEARFEMELEQLGVAIQAHDPQCASMLAVSVGNEDMNDINEAGGYGNKELKRKTVDLLVSQMDRTRQLLRRLGCCNVPVTHTDTWDEMSNPGFDWVPRLLDATDQAVIVNIFPYWSNSSVPNSWNMVTENSLIAMKAANERGRDLWLGETGWGRSSGNDSHFPNIYGSDAASHEEYWKTFGCQMLTGSGTSFYYADWDEGAVPSFGIFNHLYQPFFDLNCDTEQAKQNVSMAMPKYMGGMGIGFQDGTGG